MLINEHNEYTLSRGVEGSIVYGNAAVVLYVAVILTNIPSNL